MRVLLVSTYELGHQPLGVAGPASALREAGFDVDVADLSVEALDRRRVELADAAVFAVPMHTATELALEAAGRLRRERPEVPFAFVGLYAGVLEGNGLVREGDLLAAGEAGGPLLEWLAARQGGGVRPGQGEARPLLDIGPATLGPTPLPARELLPPLEAYARLEQGALCSVAASVEASRGCNHRCRHCPVAALYHGRSRAIELESVLADIAQVVAAGARHVSFADPDFLNRPRHALAVARGLGERFPGVSFDATVKVEHVLRHAALWPELAALGLAFVVSAFESTDDAVLAALDKGHTASDEREAVRVLRSAGIEVRPSWLPFTPWTTPGALAGLLTFSAEADLVWNTDPVQYSIRLLLPRGSLLLDDPDPVLAEAVRAAFGSQGGVGGDWAASVPWRHRERRLDELQAEIASLAQSDAAAGRAPDESFSRLWSLSLDAGVPLAPEPPPPDDRVASSLRGPLRPRLSEPWFCCAEPTSAQLDIVRR